MTTFERVSRCKTITTRSWRRTGEPDTHTTRTVVVTHYRVTGAESVSRAGLYASADDRRYVPSTVTIEYTGGTCMDITVTGQLLRKDGTLGYRTHELHGFRYLRPGDVCAQWLAAIVEDAERWSR